MPFQYLRRIYLGDTDAAGVVYFAQGLAICHEAYEESLATANISLQKILREQKIALPIVHAEIDFRHPLFCGDRITVELAAELINSNEFRLNYQIFNRDNPDKAIVQAQTRHVCISPSQRNRIDLPPFILTWINQELS